MIFVFQLEKIEKISNIHVLIQEPTEQAITDFFDKNLREIDSIVQSVMRNPDIDIAELVLESKGQEITILYGVTGDVVPLLPENQKQEPTDIRSAIEKKNAANP